VHGGVGVLVVLQGVEVVLGQRDVVGQHRTDPDVHRRARQVRQPSASITSASITCAPDASPAYRPGPTAAMRSPSTTTCPPK
jgi:hypothetical protein